MLKVVWKVVLQQFLGYFCSDWNSQSENNTIGVHMNKELYKYGRNLPLT